MRKDIIGGSAGNREHMGREAALASYRGKQVEPNTAQCLSFRNPLEEGGSRFVVILSRSMLRRKKGDFDDAFLLRAAEFGDVNAMRRLLREGADKNTRNTHERTPLMEACWSGMIDAAKLLIRRKADLDAKDMRGKTALMYAAECGHTEIVGLLLKAGAKTEDKDKLGETAYEKARGRGRAECAELLAAAEIKLRKAAEPG